MHQLVSNTLKRNSKGSIEAKCICGWSSTHFSSFAASAAFMEHKEEREEIDKREQK